MLVKNDASQFDLRSDMRVENPPPAGMGIAVDLQIDAGRKVDGPDCTTWAS